MADLSLIAMVLGAFLAAGVNVAVAMRDAFKGAAHINGAHAPSNLEKLRDLSRNLIETEHELSAFFYLCPCLLYIADNERFLKVNNAFSNLLGWNPEEITSVSWQSLMHPDDLIQTQIAHRRRDAFGTRSHSFTNRIRHKDGSYRVISWHSSFRHDDKLFFGIATASSTPALHWTAPECAKCPTYLTGGGS